MNAYNFYRLARWFYERKVPVIPKLIKSLIYLLFNSFVPYTAKIGKGTVFGYGGMGVVLHKNSVIGEKCLVGQQVTVGSNVAYFTKELMTDVPVIGNNVYIGAGAKILGNIKIGNNSVIGANAVVIKDVPENGIVAGVPAKLIRIKESVSEAVR